MAVPNGDGSVARWFGTSTDIHEQKRAEESSRFLAEASAALAGGYEVARRIREQPGLGKVVLAALTGWGQQEDRRRTAEAGFNYHLVKPPAPEAVESVLAELKRGKKRGTSGRGNTA